jgi:hypothetical protein
MSWYGIIWTTRSNQITEQDLTSNVQQIGIHLSTDFYLPFELISIILLVACGVLLSGFQKSKMFWTVFVPSSLANRTRNFDAVPWSKEAPPLQALTIFYFVNAPLPHPLF